MRQSKPMTKTMKASEARQNFSELLNEVFRRETRVLVEKSGIPVAAIVSTQDLELLVLMETQRAERFKMLDETREAFKDIPDEELEREVAKALTSARQKRRKETEGGAATK